MPAYLSHAIMGEDLYHQVAQNDHLFRVPIQLSELKAFCLGQDLSLFSGQLNHYDSHNQKTRIFFIHLIQYIKENNLKEDPTTMALLYGHIAHYFFDVTAHPFIYSIQSNCNAKPFISSHTLIEGFISSYLLESILKKNYMSIKEDYLGVLNLSNQNVIATLKNVYLSTYKDKNVLLSYKAIFNAFKALEKLIKTPSFITKDFLVKKTNFLQFLEKNQLDRSDLINEFHLPWKNIHNEEVHFESLRELYYQAIAKTIEAIHEVNKYIYDNNKTVSLEHIFNDLSYDTGLPCLKKKR